jgi:hypothetical protein
MVRKSLVPKSIKIITGPRYGLHPNSALKQAWFASPWCQNQLKSSLGHVRVYNQTLLSNKHGSQFPGARTN